MILQYRQPDHLMADVKTLNQSARAFNRTIRRFRFTGAYVTPTLIKTLMDPSQHALHPYILRALIEMHNHAVEPLCKVIPNLPPAAQLWATSVLLEIGHPDATPSLRHLFEDPRTNQEIKDVALRAYAKLVKFIEPSSTDSSSEILGVTYTSEELWAKWTRRHTLNLLKLRARLQADKYIPGITDPNGPSHGPGHVIRGGEFNSYPWQCRSAARKWFGPEYRNLHVGFRVVLELDQAEQIEDAASQAPIQSR